MKATSWNEEALLESVFDKMRSYIEYLIILLGLSLVLFINNRVSQTLTPTEFINNRVSQTLTPTENIYNIFNTN